MEKYKNIMAEIQKNPQIEIAPPDGDFLNGMKDDLEDFLNQVSFIPVDN